MEQNDEIVEDNDIVNSCELATLEGVREDNQDDEDSLNGIDVGVDFRHRGEAAKDGRDETWEGTVRKEKIHPAFWGGVDNDGERDYLMRL